MVMTYRGIGPWGAGKGSNLTAAEVDGNFWDLVQRIKSLEDDPVEPIGIADITMVGNQITIHATNGEVFGPFNVPVAAFSWMGEWEPSTSYDPFDVFVVPGTGQYLVINPHVSPPVFNPNSADIVLMFAIPDQAVVPIVNAEVPSSGDYELTLFHMGKFLRFDASARVLITAPFTTSAPIGSVVVVTRTSSGDVEIVAGVGVVIQTAETYFLRAPYSSATIIKTAANEWQVVGDMEQLD
jgi:hypothetical protein